MDLRDKITTLLSVCYRGYSFSVEVAPADGMDARWVAWIAWERPCFALPMNDHGTTAEEALVSLWDRVQKTARVMVSSAESTLETLQRATDSAARDARVTTDRLAALRMAMRNTEANPRDPDLLHDAPSPPDAPARSKIAAVWGWCFGRKGTVQTEETVRDGKPWRHAWVDEDGQLALHGYGVTDEDALADLWSEVQRTEKDMRAAREAQRSVCRQRILKDQEAEAALAASIAEIDRIMAEETGP